MDINKFLESYFPDTHWLNKSMELSKDSFGTYWYLKKFIVYYYYVFIKRKLEKKEIDEIIIIFDKYINSIHDSARSDCAKLFYSINIKEKDCFITMSTYLSSESPIDEKEIENARKFYFAYLMNSAQQNKDKELILNFTLKEKNYTSGIIKAKQNLRLKHSDAQIIQLIADVYSFLRNERILLFNYGLLNQSILRKEAYSPSRLGFLAIYANYNELIMIIEIQKLKQVSRNPLTFYAHTVNRPRNRIFKKNSIKSEEISELMLRKHPYLTILDFLNINGYVNLEIYKYYLSRTNDSHFISSIKDYRELIEIRNSVINKDLKCISPGLNNKSSEPIGPEDFSKEYKKYIYGIDENSKYDNNFIVFTKKSDKKIIMLKDRIEVILKYYKKIIEILDNKYESEYLSFELINREKYRSHINNQKFEINSFKNLKIYEQWLNYYQSINKEIYFEFLNMVKEVNNFSDKKLYDEYKNIASSIFGLKFSENWLPKILEKPAEQFNDSLIVPKKVNLDELIFESEKYANIINGNLEKRKRNTVLTYKYTIYTKQTLGQFKCEMCGTKLTEKPSGLPYGEVHHLIPFNDYDAFGPDHYLNLITVCYACHRRYHFEKLSIDINESIEKNSLFKLNIYRRLELLVNEKILFQASIDYIFLKGLISRKQLDDLGGKLL